MKVIIVGAGVIGVTSAWYLANAGCEVTVVDRQADAGLETSFANAGQISPGYASPWGAPGIPLKAAKWLLQRHAPLAISPDGSYFQLQWLYQMYTNCSQDAYQVNKQRMQNLAHYSLELLKDLRHKLNLDYENKSGGTLQLFRTKAQVEATSKDIQVLEECGVEYQLLDPEGCIQVEPALAYVRNTIRGGLRLPGDETGDCRLFVQSLVKACEELGVKFMFNTSVLNIVRRNQEITSLECNNGSYQADCYLIAGGSFSRQLLQQLKLDLPVYPVKGYSLTIPITNPGAAPVSTVLDETYKVAITRFKSRIRVGGMAELAGYNLDLSDRRRETLEKVVTDLFPHGGDLAEAQFWTGLRPMTPDSTPIIGSTPLNNLYLNTGHGTLGWTMATGSGQLITDLIMHGKSPLAAAEDYGLSRYQTA